MRDAVGATGRITIGDFSEIFFMDLSYWGVDQYERSWRSALRHLLSGDGSISCLVSSITEPSTSNFVFTWPLYRLTEDVAVRNSILFLDELDSPFDAEQPWKSVRPRRVTDEDGDRISEWRVSIAAIREFLVGPPASSAE
ncbi:hypothetical protein [Luteimicrobium subarcticum]|nr:hypothetical protein [Luteimicrobium subarcticum]